MQNVQPKGKGYYKWRGCDRKKKFRSIDDAMIAGKFSIAKTQQPLFTYLCAFCNNWHLTHTKTKYKVF